MLFTNWLEDKSKIILFDGAMGTQLMNRDLEPGKIPDLLNIENPEVVKKVLASYYDAGSDMVQTCTFSSNVVSLNRHNISNLYQKINVEAINNIKAILPSEENLIVGDIGPSGEFRPPVGNASGDMWKAGFQKQAKILAPGIDLWHIETISDLQEMSAAIQGIKEVSEKPIIASMTYRKTKTRGFFTIMGDSVETCVTKLEEEKVDVIGTNCTLGSDQMIELIKELVNLTDIPISAKPNAGQPRLSGGNTLYDQPVEDYVNDIGQMIDLGVKIVGGCCGTTPTHIRKIRTLIDSR